MCLITKTILHRLIISTLFVTSTLLAGVWLTQSLRFIQIIVNHNISIADYFALVSFLLPDLLAQILPICVFISILFTYNRIDHDHELLAFRASGRSNWQLAKPGVIFSCSIMIVITLMNLYVIPASYRLFRDQEHAIRNELTSIFLQEGAFKTLRGVTAYIKSRNLDSSLNNIFIYYTDKSGNQPRTYAIMAQRGKIAAAPEGPRLILQDGTRQEVNKNLQQSSFFRFEEVSYDLSTMVNDAQPRAIKPYEKSLWELLFPGDDTKDPFIISKMRAEAHQRLMLPLFTLILALIALNTVLRRKMGRQRGVLRLIAGTAVAISIYVLILGLINLNTHLNLAILLAYLTALTTIIFGFFTLDRTRKSRNMNKAIFILSLSTFSLNTVYGSGDVLLDSTANNYSTPEGSLPDIPSKQPDGSVQEILEDEEAMHDPINEIIESKDLFMINEAANEAESTGELDDAKKLYEASLAISNDAYTRSRYGVLLLNSESEWKLGATQLVTSVKKCDIAEAFLQRINKLIVEDI